MQRPPSVFVKHRRFCLAAFALLTVLALSGCGGGGGGVGNSSSTTSNGFRIVPAGGPVIPATGVVLNTSSGVVDTGVQVSAGTLSTASLPGTLPSSTTAVAAYQLTFSPQQPTLNSPITLTLSYPPPPAGVDVTTYQIYTYAGGQWVPLPGNSTTQTGVVSALMNGPLGSSVPGTAFPFPPSLNTFSDSGVYAILSNTAPSPPSFDPAPNQSVPALTTLTPTSVSLATVTGTTLPLTLTGTGLTNVTQVTLGGQPPLPVTAANDTTIIVNVPKTTLQAASLAGGTISVTATNPNQTPLFTTSNGLTLTVTP